jgi:hypothetical protein
MNTDNKEDLIFQVFLSAFICVSPRLRFLLLEGIAWLTLPAR